MTIIFLVYGFALGVLAFLFWKLIFGDKKISIPDYVDCDECGVRLKWIKARERDTLWFYGKKAETKYYCDRHVPSWDLRDARSIPFRYFIDKVEVEENGIIKYPFLLKLPEEYMILHRDSIATRDEAMAQDVKVATQKLGKKGLRGGKKK